MTFNIGVIASTTGAVTLSAKPARRQLRSADVARLPDALPRLARRRRHFRFTSL